MRPTPHSEHNRGFTMGNRNLPNGMLVYLSDDGGEHNTFLAFFFQIKGCGSNVRYILYLGLVGFGRLRSAKVLVGDLPCYIRHMRPPGA